MIHPIVGSDENKSSCLNDMFYTIVAWDDTLPAFDPAPMLKTVLLSPNSVKKFNHVVLKFSRLIGPSIFVGFIFRLATFVSPVSAGRVLAPIAVILQIPGAIVSAAQLRTEYVKILLRTFDFWFLQMTSTVWAIVFSAVLNDSRVVLVFASWVSFILWILQEAYLRNSSFVVWAALWEWIFFAMLMATLSLDLVDDIHHYDLLAARNHKLSTKDVLVNVMGTMATLSLRNLYRRYVWLKVEKKRLQPATPALGYRCQISFGLPASDRSSIAPHQIPMIREATREVPYSDSIRPSDLDAKISKRLLLQMHLAAETQIDPRDTVWPRIGALTPLPAWTTTLLDMCGQIGGAFATLTLFLPKSSLLDAIAITSVITSVIYAGVVACCYQRQLLKRLLTSFHFVFLALQIIAVNASIYELYERRWQPACTVVPGIFLGFTILTVDALTPSMKQRLRFKFWIPIAGIVLSSTVYTFLVLDALVLENLDLQDRVFLDYTILGRRSQFQVGPFMLSRLVTIFVWSGRFVYIALTRKDDSALILLRGDVEFNYESWKKQAIRGRR